MNEAKVPSETKWEYVDIFLFSNGQQQTPPRKYHLRSSDLSSWNNTLRQLAHSQYETIFSTIDLYTTDGQKVLTPMQVSHGVAYVAVPPQDTFIPAGYNEYLLRASRSREKRKSTNFSVDESQIYTNHNLSKENGDLNVLNEEKEIAATTINTNILSVPSKRESQNLTNKKNLNGSKLSEKKVSNNKISTLRNSNILSPSSARKTSMKTKDNIIRKNLKVNTSTVVPTESKEKDNSNTTNIIKPISKVITKINKSVENETAAVLPIELSVVDGSIYKNLSFEKTISTEVSAVGNILDDRELIVVKNPDSEIASMFLDPDKSASVFTRQNKYTTGLLLTPINENENSDLSKEVALTTIQNITGSVQHSDIAIINDAISKPQVMATNNALHHKSINGKPNCDMELNHESEIDEKHLVRHKQDSDSFVTVIDKRDVVNLNVKIEIRKGDGAVSTQFGASPTHTKIITEKSSQANEDQVCVNYAKPSLQTDAPVEKEKAPKIVAVHCACCHQYNIDQILHKIDSSMLKLADTNYIILLPSPQFDKSDERYKTDDPTSKSPSSSFPKQSVDNPLRKVYATTWLRDVIKSIDESKSKRPDCVTDEDKNFGEIVKVQKSLSRVEVQPEKEDVEIDNVISMVDKNMSVLNMEKEGSKELIPTNSQTRPSKDTQMTGSFILRNSIVDSPRITENSTQTDWCTMLLEARRHQDGMYSFHLPPLHVLKYYGF